LAKREQIYESSFKKRGALRQGEVISNVIHVQINLKDIRHQDSARFESIIHPWVIIVSQDCDLDWDYKARHNPKIPPSKLMQSILCCDLYEPQPNHEDKNRVVQNKNERYHFFQSCPAENDAHKQQIPELIADFKNYFSLSPGEVYARINNSEAKRRSRLRSPYLEHFSTRFYYYQCRVALPADHQSEPDAAKKQKP